MINESYRYSESLARGNLKTQVSRTNIFAMPLKGLQSSLAHLTWQANQVAAGDLSQQVHFLGEFSNSFNLMINSIREKKIIEQQFKLITEVLGEGGFLVDCSGKVIFSRRFCICTKIGESSATLKKALTPVFSLLMIPDSVRFASSR